MDLQTVRDFNKRSRAIRAKLQTLREVSVAVPNRRLDGMPKECRRPTRTESLAGFFFTRLYQQPLKMFLMI